MKNFFKNINKTTWIIIVITLMISITLLIIFLNRDIEDVEIKNAEQLRIVLKGEETITLYLGDEYVEYGYEAYDLEDNDLTDQVKVDISKLNINKVGLYEVKYNLKTNKDKTSAIRLVEVVRSTNNNREFNLTLNGEMAKTIERNSDYVESGFTAYDSIDGDITNNVIVSEIDTSVIDEQMITYTIKNSNNDVIVKNRLINVVAGELSLELIGSNNITISQDSNFIDPGYYAYDEIDEDISNEVIVTGSVNTKRVGSYTLTYTITNSRNKKEVVTRTVNVISNEIEKPEVGVLSFVLNGPSTITLMEKEAYVEYGTTAIDSIDGNISKNVKIIGNVDTNKLGKYYLLYIISNKSGQTKTLIRTVNVVAKPSTKLVITTELDIKNVTNSSVNISIFVTGDNFDYLVLPDLTRTTESSINYKVDNNGNYVVKAYNKKGEETIHSISITNIDKLGPKGNCILNINREEGIIKVTAEDNLSIVDGYKYKVGTENYSEYGSSPEFKFTVNNYIETSVTVKDALGNETELFCTKGNVVYGPVKTLGKTIRTATSDSLIVKMTKNDKYTLTYIWAQNPYLQIHQYTTYQSKKKPSTFNQLMQGALKNTGIKNKVAFAINNNVAGSYGTKNGFKEYGRLGYTIVEGETLRRDITSNVLRSAIWGIGKDNLMYLFYDHKNLESEKRENQYKEIDKLEMNNTFLGSRKWFYKNGNKTIKNNSSGYLQAFCQINENNFVYLSGYTSTKAIINKTEAMNCRIATVIDGGGSTTIRFKNAKMNSWKKIFGSGERTGWSIAYWTEL